VADKVVYVGFFGDGPKWDNFVLTLAPPAGVTNHRPFRYGDNRVASDVLRDIATPAGSEGLKQEGAVLAARFGAAKDTASERLWWLLPLREVQIDHLDYSPGNHSVYFRAGALFDFRGVEDIRDALVNVPDEERGDLGGDAIFFRSTIKPLLGIVDLDEEREVWARLCDLLADDVSPINDMAKRAVYLRPRPPRRKKKTNSVDNLFDSEVEGPKYGWPLRESLTYELAWDHRVPSLIGTTRSVNGLTITSRLDSANIELANRETLVSSNYEQHALGVTARVPSGTFDILSFSPNVEQAVDSKGDPILAIEVRVPVAVRKNLAYRLRRSVATIGALAIVVTASLLSEEVKAKGWLDALWSAAGLRTFLLAAAPVIVLKVIEEGFKQ
jgi:hypothetical protein